jgi:hypothetical protein
MWYKLKFGKWHSFKILFTNRYGNLQEMLEMASFLKYVDLHLKSEWGRFYVGHSVGLRRCWSALAKSLGLFYGQIIVLFCE